MTSDILTHSDCVKNHLPVSDIKQKIFGIPYMQLIGISLLAWDMFSHIGTMSSCLYDSGSAWYLLVGGRLRRWRVSVSTVTRTVPRVVPHRCKLTISSRCSKFTVVRS